MSSPDAPRSPVDVIPEPLADAVREVPYWFVIGGQAVRCLCPYRPSDDVDFGVGEAPDLQGLVDELRRGGTVRELERGEDTLHLTWNGIDVSIFVLPKVSAHVEDRRLTVTGVLATKLHAIVDRGTRRDFFDLYVTLQQQRLGLVECMAAIRTVYETDVPEGLLLRALSYFDDADAEPPLPGEGADDWKTVKDFFATRVGALLVPPERRLSIQSQVVGVR